MKFEAVRQRLKARFWWINSSSPFSSDTGQRQANTATTAEAYPLVIARAFGENIFEHHLKNRREGGHDRILKYNVRKYTQFGQEHLNKYFERKRGELTATFDHLGELIKD